MRVLPYILFSYLLFNAAFAQQLSVVDSFGQLHSPIAADSLRKVLLNSRADSNRVLTISHLVFPITFSKPDSAMYLAQEGLSLARKINYNRGIILCEKGIAAVWWILGDYTRAEEICIKTFKAAKALNDHEAMAWSQAILVSSYRDEGNLGEALAQAIEARKNNFFFGEKIWNTMLGSVYVELNRLDSAIQRLLNGDVNDGYNHLLLGDVYRKLGNHALALDHYRKAISILEYRANFKDLALTYVGLANLYKNQNKLDSALYFAKKGYRIAQGASFKKWVFETSLIISQVYEKNNPKQSLYYYKIAMAAKDSVFNLQKTTEALTARYEEQIRQQQAVTIAANYRNKVRTYALLAGLAILLLLAAILIRNNRLQQKAKVKIENAYQELKATQAQLIQSEKMASLGELTAGIAHEIQNPLNFVNNFSEVNKELIDELESERLKEDGERSKELEVQILKDIKQNLVKINEHGKRADSIVKGMLQHSRTASGQKEPTDINALADEYLKLAYHAMRAKDKSFNAILQTDLDRSLVRIPLVPQDIGRVLLNLYNNAFYSMLEKAKSSLIEYGPTISVTTKQIDHKILITVRDNGIGIPEKIKDKIFQPFFTTKPAGTGTGLGLSLSYDIITKEHGGEIKIDSREGEGAEFIVSLPV